MNNFLISYLIHACMDEGVLGFWNGRLSSEHGHFLLRVARGITSASLWLMRVVDAFVRLWTTLKLQRC